MALISVAELLLDPDFVDSVTVYRQVMKVDEDGVGRYQPVAIPILASIQAQGSDKLVMPPELSRTEGFYEIITTSPLMTASDATAADTVEWHGRMFCVISVDRFDNFQNGFGHYEGVMELMSINPVPTDAQ